LCSYNFFHFFLNHTFVFIYSKLYSNERNKKNINGDNSIAIVKDMSLNIIVAIVNARALTIRNEIVEVECDWWIVTVRYNDSLWHPTI
jgi:hypothetical protein